MGTSVSSTVDPWLEYRSRKRTVLILLVATVLAGAGIKLVLLRWALPLVAEHTNLAILLWAIPFVLQPTIMYDTRRSGKSTVLASRELSLCTSVVGGGYGILMTNIG
jgi:hypothetical protein